MFADKIVIQSKNRPLVLVAHCFGGVILKQARPFQPGNLIY